MILPKLVADFLAAHGLATKPGVVAVSGGPDSVALLRALTAGQQPQKGIHVAHVNYRLRGVESDTDEAFVTALCSSLGVTCHIHSCDVRQRLAQEGGNLESVARDTRYAFMKELAQAQGAAWIATGHTADDQAETVLHRLLRGTGLKGLAGIPACRDLAPGVALIRPLLRTRREEVLHYLGEIGQDYRTDASNADPRFTRNRIRAELLPLLAEKFNPAIVDVLGRLAEQSADVQQREEAAAEALLREAELPRAGDKVILRRPPLESVARHVLRELFHVLWQREHWPMRAMGFEAWDRLAGVARGEHAAVEMPGKIQALCRDGVMVIARL